MELVEILPACCADTAAAATTRRYNEPVSHGYGKIYRGQEAFTQVIIYPVPIRGFDAAGVSLESRSMRAKREKKMEKMEKNPLVSPD